MNRHHTIRMNAASRLLTVLAVLFCGSLILTLFGQVNVPVCSVNIDADEWIQLNGDDDDKNGSFDFKDEGPSANEDDLKKITLTAVPNLAGTLTFKAIRNGETQLKFYKNPDKSEEIEIGDDGLTWSVSKSGGVVVYEPTDQPIEFYMEGILKSESLGTDSTELSLVYVESGSGSCTDSDSKEIVIYDFDVDLLGRSDDEQDEEEEITEEARVYLTTFLSTDDDLVRDDQDSSLADASSKFHRIELNRPEFLTGNIKVILTYQKEGFAMDSTQNPSNGLRLYNAYPQGLDTLGRDVLDEGVEINWDSIALGDGQKKELWIEAVGTIDSFDVEVTIKEDEIELSDTIKITSALGGGGKRDFSLFTNADEAASPKYRKIGLNGRPLSDEKPQGAKESDEEREQTYVDALTQRLSHSVTDIYVRVPASDLALTVRRNNQSQLWLNDSGLTPQEDPTLCFGPCWTSNLCSYVHFEEQMVGPANNQNGLVAALGAVDREISKVSQNSPNTATVVDHEGNSYRFIIQYTGAELSFIPLPTGRHHQEVYLSKLAFENGSLVFRKKYGTELRFTPTVVERNIDSNRVITAPLQSVKHRYFALSSVSDRFGAKLDYSYPLDLSSEIDSLIPNRISVEGRPDLTVEITSSSGVVTEIQDPEENAISYRYGNSASKFLEEIEREEGTKQTYDYSYYTEDEIRPSFLSRWDLSVPSSVHTYVRSAEHYDLSEIGDSYGNKYSFSYEPNFKVKAYVVEEVRDAAGGGTDVFYSGLLCRLGQARVLREISHSSMTAEVVSFNGSHNVSVFPDGIQSKRSTAVTDFEGGVTFYSWPQYLVENLPIELAPYLDEIDGNHPNFSYLACYTQQKISYGTSPVLTETYNFNPLAGMSVSSVVDISGNTTSYEYSEDVDPADAEGLYLEGSSFVQYPEPTRELNALGYAKTFGYGVYRTMNSVIDEEGRRTSYLLDGGGGAPLGLRTGKRVFGPSSLIPIEIEDYEYLDPNFPSFQTRTVKRAAGTSNSATDPQWVSDLASINVADGDGRLAHSGTDMDGNGVLDRTAGDLVTSYLYDKNGNQKKVTDPKGLETTFFYDGENRLTRVLYQDQTEKNFTYDRRGLKVQVEDENGNKTAFIYDGLGRLSSSVVDMDGNLVVTVGTVGVSYSGHNDVQDLVTEFFYNRVNSQVRVKDPRANSTVTDYDVLQRPIKTYRPLPERAPNYIPDDSDYVTEMFYDGPNIGSTAFNVSGLRATSIVDSRGYETTFKYDSLYRLTEEYSQYEIGDGTTTVDAYVGKTSEYDKVGNLRFQTSLLSGVSREGAAIGGGAADFLKSETRYDALNRPVWTSRVEHSTASELGGYSETIYTATGLPHKTVDELSAAETRTTDAVFDRAGRLVESLQPEVYDAASASILRPLTTTFYDSNGNVDYLINPLGRRWDYKYDQRNRKIEEEGPPVSDSGSVNFSRPLTQFFYDNVGNVSKVIDPRGAAALTFYDAANRPVLSRSNPVDGQPSEDQSLPNLFDVSTKSVYDKNGNVVSLIDGNGNTTRNAYDSLDRLSATATNPQTGNPAELSAQAPSVDDIIVFNQYDGSNNLTQVVDGEGAIVAFEYDGLNRQTATIWDSGAPAEKRDKMVSFDGPNLVSREDANGQVTNYSYDSFNRIDVVSYAGRPQDNTHSFYDYIDRLLEVNYPTESDPTRQSQRETKIKYDALDRAVEERSAGLTHVYGYDLAGNRLTTSYGGTGRFLECEYDALNRLRECSERASKSAPVSFDTTYQYDLAGNVTRKTLPNSSFAKCSFDFLGRKLKEVSFKSDGTNIISSFDYSQEVSGFPSGYDNVGNVLKVFERYPQNVADPIFDRNVFNTYDKVYRLAVESIISNEGTLPTITTVQTSSKYSYDKANNRSSRIVNVNRETSAVEGGGENDYNFDSEGVPSPLPTTGSPRQIYRVGGQYILSFGDGGGETYVYGDGVDGYNSNQLALVLGESSTTRFEYDNNGNRISTTVGSALTQTYLYDYENRLVELTDTTKGDFEYGYDYRTRRVIRDESIGTSGDQVSLSFSGGTSVLETDSFYFPVEHPDADADGDGLSNFEEFDGDSDPLDASNGSVYTGSEVYSVWAEDEILSRISEAQLQSYYLGFDAQTEYIRGSDYGGGIGGILYTIRGTDRSYNAYNSRGDVVSKTDDSETITWQSSYEAFGTRTQEEGATEDRQKANTKDEDPTGLLNEGMRYRDIEFGVFLTRDPAGFVDGPNVYTYVRQNPWSAYDPEGLFLGFIADAGFAVYDTVQYSRGKISGKEYSKRMALTGASVLANAASGGTAGLAVRGASMAARAGSATVKVAKAVDKANTAYETASSIAANAEAMAGAISEGDARGMAKAAVGMALDSAGGKKTDGSLGASSQRKTKAQTGAQVEAEAPKTTTVYRGVNSNHFDFAAQSGGVVRPNNKWWQVWKGKGSSPFEHNAAPGGTLNSPYTSWTTDPRVAENFALRPGRTPGMVIEAQVPTSRLLTSPNTKNVSLIQGGGVVSESEVLIRGTVRGTATGR